MVFAAFILNHATNACFNHLQPLSVIVSDHATVSKKCLCEFYCVKCVQAIFIMKLFKALRTDTKSRLQVAFFKKIQLEITEPSERVKFRFEQDRSCRTGWLPGGRQ